MTDVIIVFIIFFLNIYIFFNRGARLRDGHHEQGLLVPVLRATPGLFTARPQARPDARGADD